MGSNDSKEAAREIVVPGELLAISSKRAGPGTYSEGGKIYAAHLGIKSVRPDSISVVPLSGQYMPMRGDLVVGKIIGVGSSNWLVDINSPYPSPLHVNEVPWRVEFGETRKFMSVGDIVLLKIVGVDEIKSTLMDRLRLEDAGPGYCHFPRGQGRGYVQSWFDGLLSEHHILVRRAGKERMEWVQPTGVRNEPLDCRVYATAALEILSPPLDASVTKGKASAVAPGGGARRSGRRVLGRGVG